MSAKKLPHDPSTPPGSPASSASSAPPVNGSALGHVGDLDIERFKIDQDFAAHVQTRRKALVVPVGRPDKQTWIYPHPDRAWRMSVGMLDDKANQRHYVVAPDIIPEIMGDLVPKLLVPYATRQGSTGLWAIRLPDEGGRIDTYNESALVIVEEYAGQWIRVVTNQETRAYDVVPCPIEIPTPKFPEGGIKYLFNIAFRNRVIENLEHPVLKALRGAL